MRRFRIPIVALALGALLIGMTGGVAQATFPRIGMRGSWPVTARAPTT